jgi:hypothetical protein
MQESNLRCWLKDHRSTIELIGQFDPDRTRTCKSHDLNISVYHSTTGPKRAEWDSNPRTIKERLANLRVWPLRHPPFKKCPWRDLNPHALAADFKSTTSTNSVTRANLQAEGIEPSSMILKTTTLPLSYAYIPMGGIEPTFLWFSVKYSTIELHRFKY